MNRVAKKPRTRKEINQQRKRRSKGLFKKGAELHHLCNCDVALFTYDRETGQHKMLITTGDPEWQQLFDHIVS
jgi:hypothetical protein